MASAEAAPLTPVPPVPPRDARVLARAADNQPLRLGLANLPDEILLSIFGYVQEDSGVLNAAVRVNKHFNDLSEPFLYNAIILTTGWQAACLTYAIDRRGSRATWIRSLLVSCGIDDFDGLESLPPKIRLMQNLGDLVLESPDCNKLSSTHRIPWMNLQARYERIFESSSLVIRDPSQRYLPSLRSCTLHFVDSRSEIYGLANYSMLFLHPTLRSLRISCASTDYPNELLRPFQDDHTLLKSTALEHLHLEECDIHAQSLAILLSFARHLKSLKISEGTRYTGWIGAPRKHGDVYPSKLVEAIRSQCLDSLESLSLSLGYIRPRQQSIIVGQHLDLADFESLLHLEVDMPTLELVRTRPRCDHSTWRRLPPNLQSLKVFGIPLAFQMPSRAVNIPLIPLEQCVITDRVSHGVPDLKYLSYTYEVLQESPIEDEGMRRAVYEHNQRSKALVVAEIAKNLPNLKKAGVRLKMILRYVPTGFIPPYLYAETKGRQETCWDSDEHEVPDCTRSKRPAPTETSDGSSCGHDNQRVQLSQH